MPPRVDDVMELCCKLSTNWRIKAAVKNAWKGTMMAGGSAFLGGMVLGPPGLLVGGMVGGLLGYWKTRGQFKSVPQIIKELPLEKQQKLYEDIMAVLGSLYWTDVKQLIACVMDSDTLQQKVTDTLLSYMTQTLQAEVQQKN